MARFPITLDSDSTEVRDALEIARTQYVRGELQDAMRWLRRAADIAFERGADERGVALSKAAVELGPPRPPSARSAAAQEPQASPRSPPASPSLSTPPPQPRAVPPSPAQPHVAAPVPANSRLPQPPSPGSSPASSQRSPRHPASSRASVSSPRAAPPRASASSPPDMAVPPTPALQVTAPRTSAHGERLPADTTPIPLTARKVDDPVGDEPSTDEITAITAMSPNIAAAIAFDRAERAAASRPAPEPPRKPSSSRAQAPTGAAGIEPVMARKPSPVARATPRQKPSPASPPEAPADATTPSLSLTTALAEKAVPRPHQALRVALARNGTGQVIARALGPEGARAGEIEALVVGVAQSADLLALFTE